MATELFVNSWRAALNAAINATATSLTLISAAGAPAHNNFRARIDNEIILVGASSGTTWSSLARGREGTTASAHNAGAIVRLPLTAQGLISFQPFPLCCGRLTTETGVSVSTSDRSAQTSIFFTPIEGNFIGLYDGASQWSVFSFSEVSMALSGRTANTNYDVFAYDNAGAVALELSAGWSSNTSRADAIAQQDGVDVKSADHTRRLVGTIRASGTTTVEDTRLKRFVWSRYNRVSRGIFNTNGSSHDYNSATARYWNDDANNKVEFVVGAIDRETGIAISDWMYTSSVGVGVYTTVALNWVSGAPAAGTYARVGKNESYGSHSMSIQLPPSLGYNYFAVIENASAGTAHHDQYDASGFVWN